MGIYKYLLDICFGISNFDYRLLLYCVKYANGYNTDSK